MSTESQQTTGRFWMPHESAVHTRSFMQWPCQKSIYGGQRTLESVQADVLSIARTIGRYEPVVLLAGSGQHVHLKETLGSGRGGENIALWSVETDDLWCRDSGPQCVVSDDHRLAVVDPGFHGWGHRQQCKQDSHVARRVAALLDVPCLTNGLVGEGGGIEVDGEGTALAHESSWFGNHRNRLSKDEVNRRLGAALGIEHVIWAPGLSGADMTDYHIDALARFVKPGQVVIQLPDVVDRSDPWSVAAFATYEVLKRARDAHGRKLDITVISEPRRIRSRAADFVASYVNYAVCNGAVITAEYGDDKADESARHMLGQLFPGRTVHSLAVDALGAAGGGIHCATQQQPALQ